MKKIITVLLCILMLVSLTACAGNLAASPGSWTLDSVPVPDEMKDFEAERGEDYLYYVNRNLDYDVLTAYEDLLRKKGFTIVPSVQESNVYEAVATNGNATIRLYFETADWDLTDPEFRANGGAGLDTSIFAIEISIAAE